MTDITNEGNKRDLGTPALEQMYGKGVARSAAKQRRRKTLEVTSEGRRAGWGTYAILVVTILIFVFPLYVALSIASQSSSSTQYGVQALIFGSGLIKNISRAFGAMKFWQALSGTLFVAIVTSVSTVFFSTLAGYSFSKLRFRGRGVLFTIVMFVGVLDVVLGFIIKACFRGSLRVSEAEEAQGLDVATHGESAYPAYVGLD